MHSARSSNKTYLHTPRSHITAAWFRMCQTSVALTPSSWFAVYSASQSKNTQIHFKFDTRGMPIVCISTYTMLKWTMAKLPSSLQNGYTCLSYKKGCTCFSYERGLLVNVHHTQNDIPIILSHRKGVIMSSFYI